MYRDFIMARPGLFWRRALAGFTVEQGARDGHSAGASFPLNLTFPVAGYAAERGMNQQTNEGHPKILRENATRIRFERLTQTLPGLARVLRLPVEHRRVEQIQRKDARLEVLAIRRQVLEEVFGRFD